MLYNTYIILLARSKGQQSPVKETLARRSNAEFLFYVG